VTDGDRISTVDAAGGKGRRGKGQSDRVTITKNKKKKRKKWDSFASGVVP